MPLHHLDHIIRVCVIYYTFMFYKCILDETKKFRITFPNFFLVEILRSEYCSSSAENNMLLNLDLLLL